MYLVIILFSFSLISIIYYQNRGNKSSCLPSLPSSTPRLIAKLIEAMLEPNPTKRITAKKAANICQLLLWAPASWTNVMHQGSKSSSIFSRKYNRRESKNDLLLEEKSTTSILQWLLTLTTKLLYEARFSKFEEKGQPGGYEYQLVATFLSRIQLHDVKLALNWIQQN